MQSATAQQHSSTPNKTEGEGIRRGYRWKMEERLRVTCCLLDPGLCRTEGGRRRGLAVAWRGRRGIEHRQELRGGVQRVERQPPAVALP